LSALPIIAIELGNGVSGILGRLKCNNTGTLWTAIGRNVNVSAKNLTIVGSLAEEIL
jgi:hypothetical protein